MKLFRDVADLPAEGLAGEGGDLELHFGGALKGG
jgi:hypothetical protein